MTSRELYDAAKAAGVPIGNHYSDLYLKATPTALALVKQYDHKQSVASFTSQIDGARWLDVPFAFMPYWDARGASKVAP